VKSISLGARIEGSHLLNGGEKRARVRADFSSRIFSARADFDFLETPLAEYCSVGGRKDGAAERRTEAEKQTPVKQTGMAAGKQEQRFEKRASDVDQ